MATYVALLRGVNVGGKKLLMEALRAWAAELGLIGGRTLLQSGNLVFQSDGSRAAHELETLLEDSAEIGLGLSTLFFVRDAAEWARIIRDNPFPTEAAAKPSHFLVLCFKEAPDAAALAELRAVNPGREQFQAVGRELYVTFPDGIGRSPLADKFLAAKLGRRWTGRNRNTVRKLAALAGESV